MASVVIALSIQTLFLAGVTYLVAVFASPRHASARARVGYRRAGLWARAHPVVFWIVVAIFVGAFPSGVDHLTDAHHALTRISRAGSLALDVLSLGLLFRVWQWGATVGPAAGQSTTWQNR